MADTDRDAVLRINESSRPAVAALDRIELDRLLTCGGLHLVAVAADRAIAGYALTFTHGDPYDGEEFQYFSDHLQRPFIYIDQVAADRHRKREGVGRKLYAALVVQAKARGILTLCCEVNTSPPNPVSLQFHRQLGFAPIGEQTVLDGRTVALLVKDL